MGSVRSFTNIFAYDTPLIAFSRLADWLGVLTLDTVSFNLNSTNNTICNLSFRSFWTTDAALDMYSLL